MKNLALFIIIFLSLQSFSKSVIISTETGATPNSSSILDIQSEYSGLLIPRMITDRINAIVSPATGLFVFDITKKAFYFYTGSSNGWSEFADATNNPKGVENDDKDTKVYVSSLNDTIYFMTAGTNRLIIDEKGNLGIGTFTPSSLLSLHKESSNEEEEKVMAFSVGTHDPWKLRIDTAGSKMIK